jgi:hypothetical protein
MRSPFVNAAYAEEGNAAGEFRLVLLTLKGVEILVQLGDEVWVLRELVDYLV